LTRKKVGGSKTCKIFGAVKKKRLCPVCEKAGGSSNDHFHQASPRISAYMNIMYGVPCPEFVCYRHFQQYYEHAKERFCIACKNHIAEENSPKFKSEITGVPNDVSWVCNICSTTKYLSENILDCLKEINFRKREENIVHFICYEVLQLMQRCNVKLLTQELRKEWKLPGNCTTSFICKTIQAWISNYVQCYQPNVKTLLVFRKDISIEHLLYLEVIGHPVEKKKEIDLDEIRAGIQQISQQIVLDKQNNVFLSTPELNLDQYFPNDNSLIQFLSKFVQKAEHAKVLASILVYMNNRLLTYPLPIRVCHLEVSTKLNSTIQ